MTTPQQPSTLREYLQVLRRRPWTILVVTLVAVVAAAVFSNRQEKLYKASATVLVSGFDSAQSTDMFMQTQADIATTSPEVARRVRQALGLRELPKIEVTPHTNSALLTFSSTARHPLLAQRVATSYARQYQNFQRELGAAHIRTARAFLVRPASPGVQVQPRTIRNTLLGLLFGLIVGSGLAFLRDALDAGVRSTDEISEQLGLPLLARLPPPPTKLRRHNRLVTISEPDGISAEGFKILRANVDFARMEADATTLLVTSPTEGEGKSTTVANLAVVLARAGQRVVLVDLDLRRPFLHEFFDLEGPGVAQLATGAASLDDALTPIPLVWTGASWGGADEGDVQRLGGSLEVLPAGPMPARIDDVLAKNILTGILDALRDRADVVLVDSTPLLAGDAMAASAAVDAMIIVLSMKTVRRPILRELRRVLDSIPTRKIGFVAAGANLDPTYRGNVLYGRHTRSRESVV